LAKKEHEKKQEKNFANKKIERNHRNNQKLTKIFSYLVFTIVLLFLIGGSYFRGLFFDTDNYIFAVLISILFLTYITVNYQKVKEIFKEPYIWLLTGIILLYFFHTLIADNKLLAWQQALRWLMAGEIFLFLNLILREEEQKDEIQKGEIKRNIFWITVILTGLWTSLFGWLAVFGKVNFPDAILGNRIASVFQYPNSFAAFLGGVLLSILIKLTQKNSFSLLLSPTSYLFLITIIFTYSRGVWLIFGAVWIAVLFFLRLKQQLLYIIHSLILGVAVLFSLQPLNTAIAEKNLTSGFLYLILPAVITGIIYSLINLTFAKFFNFPQTKISVLFKWLIPLVIVFTLIVSYNLIQLTSIQELLPKSLSERIKDINTETRSVVERNRFYIDAIPMIKDHPLLGAGGGAWREQFERYQSLPYVSRQAHNFYLQFIIEVGIIGFLLLLSFLAILFYQLYQKWRRNDLDFLNTFAIVIIAIFILTHSLIDFNLSYTYLLVLIFAIFGVVFEPSKFKISKNQQRISKNIGIVALGLLIILNLFSLVNGTRFWVAERTYKSINQVQIDVAKRLIDKAVSLNPFNSQYRLEKIKIYDMLYTSTKAEKYQDEVMKDLVYLDKLKEDNPTLLLAVSQWYAKEGYMGNSLQALATARLNGKWSLPVYEQSVVYLYGLAEYYAKNKEKTKGTENLQQIISLYKEVEKNREYLNQQKIAVQYPEYQITDNILLYTGKAEIALGNYQKGIEMLTPLLAKQDENIQKQTLNWLIYAYNQIGDANKEKELQNNYNNLYDEKLLAEIIKIWK